MPRKLVDLDQVRAALAGEVAGYCVEEISDFPGSRGSVSAAAELVRDVMAELEKAAQDEPEPQTIEVRPSLLWFVEIMEQKMRKGDTTRPPWNILSREYVVAHLQQEVVELGHALADGDPAEIAKEAADVANCAHILADQSYGCQFGGRGKVESAVRCDECKGKGHTSSGAHCSRCGGHGYHGKQ